MQRKENVVEQRVSFAAVGDIMLEQGLSRLIEKRGPEFPFLRVASELQSADIVFGNLEAPLTTRQEKVVWDFSKYGWTGKAKPIFLKGSPIAAIGLKNAGFDVVSIANNHVLDYGMKGLMETVDVLQTNGIVPVGFGLNAREATSPTLLEVKGLQVAFLAASFAYEATFFSPGVAPIGLWTLRRAVKKTRALSDIVVVSLHTGTEFKDSPSTSTIKLARSLVEAGANMVLCHHPHVLQSVEAYKKGVIAYSLGNFVFDYDSFRNRALARGQTEETIEKSRQTIILKCMLAKHGVVDYSILPIQLNSDCQPTAVPRGSELHQEIVEKVNAPLLPRFSSSSNKRSIRGRKEMSDALNGLVISLRRMDLKNLYILLRKVADRVHVHLVH